MDKLTDIKIEQTATIKQQRFIGKLFEWLNGHDALIYKGCVLIDISECGGALMIPKKIKPENIFDLMIHDSENREATLIIVRAELRWSDLSYTDKYTKIGFRLINDSPIKKRVINHITKQAKTKGSLNLECSLIF